MLDIVKEYIKNLPTEDFQTYYQKFILDIQDQNVQLEIPEYRPSMNVTKLLDKIRQELGNLK